MIPDQPRQYLAREIAHIDGIAALLEAGWTLTGIRLVQDPATGENGKALTLFPAEQRRVVDVLKKICAARRRELAAQQ